MILAIDDDVVREVLDMATAMAVLEGMAKASVAGDVTHAERSNLMLPGGWMRMAPAALLDRGVVGYKEFHLTPSAGIRFSIWLFDLSDGRPLALVDGKHITAIRTGASGGLAVAQLAAPGASRVALVGSSDTAFRQLEATIAVRPVEHVTVYSPTVANREGFAQRAASAFGIDVQPVADVAELATGADVLLISTDTRGDGPAVDGSLLSPGMHVNSIGSTLPNQRELHVDVWPRVDRLVVDTLGVMRDSGDLLAATESAALDAQEVVTLDEVVVGERPGRTGPDDITLYKSVGTSAQDVATAYHVYCAARAEKSGTELPDIITVKDD